MASRLRDAFDRGEARRDEVGDILQGFAFDDDEEVEACTESMMSNSGLTVRTSSKR